MFAAPPDLEVVKQIIDATIHVIDINHMNHGGATALMCCAYNRKSSVKVLRLMLDRGANINHRDNAGASLFDKFDVNR